MARAKTVGPKTAKVAVVHVEARELVTIDIPAKRAPLPAKGAIVRLRPSAEATDEQVAQLALAILAAGALKVFALPRPRARVVPQAVAEARHKFKSMGPRKVVEQLVEESNSGDKTRLREAVGVVLAEAGL